MLHTEATCVHTDHWRISKFGSESSAGFDLVCAIIQNYVSRAPQVVSSRWIDEQTQARIQKNTPLFRAESKATIPPRQRQNHNYCRLQEDKDSTMLESGRFPHAKYRNYGPNTSITSINMSSSISTLGSYERDIPRLNDSMSSTLVSCDSDLSTENGFAKQWAETQVGKERDNLTGKVGEDSNSVNQAVKQETVLQHKIRDSDDFAALRSDTLLHVPWPANFPAAIQSRLPTNSVGPPRLSSFDCVDESHDEAVDSNMTARRTSGRSAEQGRVSSAFMEATAAAASLASERYEIMTGPIHHQYHLDECLAKQQKKKRVPLVWQRHNLFGSDEQDFQRLTSHIKGESFQSIPTVQKAGFKSVHQSANAPKANAFFSHLEQMKMQGLNRLAAEVVDTWSSLEPIAMDEESKQEFIVLLNEKRKIMQQVQTFSACSLNCFLNGIIAESTFKGLIKSVRQETHR